MFADSEYLDLLSWVYFFFAEWSVGWGEIKTTGIHRGPEGPEEATPDQVSLPADQQLVIVGDYV